MTLPTPSEGGQEQSSQGLPIPKLESASAGSATSSVDPEALTEAILKRLDPILEKKLQSTKDKRIANIEKRLGMQDLEELEAMGATIPDNAKLEYRFRQLEQERQSPPSSQATTSQGSGASLTATDVSEVVKKLKLDANDADVINALRGTYRNRDHFEATMANLALARINGPAADPANSSTIAARSSSAPDKGAEIEKGYLEEMKTVPRGNVRMAANVKAKWRKKAAEAGLQLNV